MPKTVGKRRGCNNPETCGAQAAHTCGSADACPVVKSSGVVCTFGTYSGAPFHTQAELDLEADAIEDAIADEMVRLGSAPNKTAAKGLMTAAEKAKTRAEVKRGKNLWSAVAETATLAAADKHFTDNKTMHDSSPGTFHG